MADGLFLHGFTGAPSSWGAVSARLPADFVATIPWLTGHGRPGAAPEVESFDDEVGRLAALLPERAVLAGYSLGARLALGVALRAPSRVRALILISAGFGLRDAPARAERRERDRALRELLGAAGLRAFADAWQDQPLFASQAALPAPLREAERERRLGHTAEGLAHSLACTGLAEMPAYQERLCELDLPTELICGALDTKFCDAAESVVSQLPQGRFTRVNQAGHNLLLERPDAVEAAIRRGLSS